MQLSFGESIGLVRLKGKGMALAYKYLIWAVLLGFGGAGGWLGWWYASQSLYMRSVGSDILGDADIKPKVLLWRQLRRLVWAGAGVGGGLVAGMFTLTFLTRFQY